MSSNAAQDQITELLDVPKDFLKEGTQFINRAYTSLEHLVVRCTDPY